ncbi:DUF935 family protein, partial [bacterium]|nr:DUF935 family protein [bacterium]
MRQTSNIFTETGKAGRSLQPGQRGVNPDSLISLKGWDYVKELEKDTHLASQLATRRQKLIKRGWRIAEPPNPTAKEREMAEFARDQLRDMTGSFDKDLEGMLTAVSRGFSVTEINYQSVTWKSRTLVGLKSLRQKDQSWFEFRFDDFGHYTLWQTDPNADGDKIDLGKFIHVINGEDDENPYGRSVVAECSFWIWLKKNAAKFWAIYAEKFSLPTLKITVPRNVKKNSAEYALAENLIDQYQEDTGIIIPEGMLAEILEASGKGWANYEQLVDLCNKEISKRSVGATLVSEEGKRGQGSYALGSEHADLLDDYIVFDDRVLTTAVNEQLIQRLIRLNWGVVRRYPEFEFVDFSVGTFISFSQSIGNLVNAGVPIPRGWVMRMLKIPEPRDGEAVLAAAQKQQ